MMQKFNKLLFALCLLPVIGWGQIVITPPPSSGAATSVPFSGITGFPTTVGGLGLTDLSSDYVAFKTATTNRVTNTPSADPDLAFATIPTGSYVVRIRMQVFDNLTGGFQWAIGGTATISGQGRAVVWGASQFASGTAVTASITTPISGESVAPWANATRGEIVEFAITVSVAGSINLQWAQNTTSATPTGLASMSYMEIHRFTIP